MKKQCFAALLAVFCALGCVHAQQIPDVKVRNQNGDVVQTRSLADERTPVIVSFWSTTCKPCIKELDAIAEQMEDWLEEAQFRVAAVSVDDARSASRARSLAVGRGWDAHFTLIYDENQDFKRAMNVTNTPQVFILDKNGKQVYAHTGYMPGGEAELLEVIRKLK